MHFTNTTPSTKRKHIFTFQLLFSRTSLVIPRSVWCFIFHTWIAVLKHHVIRTPRHVLSAMVVSTILNPKAQFAFSGACCKLLGSSGRNCCPQSRCRPKCAAEEWRESPAPDCDSRAPGGTIEFSEESRTSAPGHDWSVLIDRLDSIRIFNLGDILELGIICSLFFFTLGLLEGARNGSKLLHF